LLLPLVKEHDRLSLLRFVIEFFGAFLKEFLCSIRHVVINARYQILSIHELVGGQLSDIGTLSATCCSLYAKFDTCSQVPFDDLNTIQVKLISHSLRSKVLLQFLAFLSIAPERYARSLSLFSFRNQLLKINEGLSSRNTPGAPLGQQPLHRIPMLLALRFFQFLQCEAILEHLRGHFL